VSIGIAYSGSGTSYNIILENFTDRAIPRAYESQANFARTASGTTSLSGSGSSQKRIWAISCLVTRQEAETLDEMFRAWDDDRAAGKAAACGLADNCFGAPVSANVLFTTPPSYVYASPSLIQVDFAVTEV